MAFNQFPYSNFHELNLDWILEQMQQLHANWDLFTAINKITFRGDWAINKNYPAWSVVKNGTRGYISITNVPAGIEIDNGKYWLHVVDYDSLFLNVESRLQLAEEKISLLTVSGQKLYDQVESLTQINALPSDAKPLRYYIDANGGDDDSDGSQDSPWQTLTPLLDIANKVDNGRSDVRCYFASAGVYDLPYMSFTGMAIHMTGLVDGVVVNQTGGDFVIYGGHFNLKNLTLRSTVPISLESTVGVFDTVTFDLYPNIWGGKCDFNKCVFNKGLGVKGGHAILRGGCIIDMHNATDAAMYGNNGFVTIYNSLTIKNASKLFDMYRTQFDMFASPICENVTAGISTFQLCNIYTTERWWKKLTENSSLNIAATAPNWIYTDNSTTPVKILTA